MWSEAGVNSMPASQCSMARKVMLSTERDSQLSLAENAEQGRRRTEGESNGGLGGERKERATGV